jgi:hypothetical protein
VPRVPSLQWRGRLRCLEVRDGRVAWLMLGGIVVYGSGVMLANLWNILTNLPVSLFYVGAFGIVFVVSAIILIAER